MHTPAPTIDLTERRILSLSSICFFKLETSDKKLRAEYKEKVPLGLKRLAAKKYATEVDNGWLLASRYLLYNDRRTFLDCLLTTKISGNYALSHTPYNKFYYDAVDAEHARTGREKREIRKDIKFLAEVLYRPDLLDPICFPRYKACEENWLMAVHDPYYMLRYVAYGSGRVRFSRTLK
jgi:hypothetical protein